MLDHTMRKASEHHITNIVPTQGDAQDLPYPDDTFDAAYMMVTLGEVPNQDAALRELRRVLKSSGRLVVGEIFGDPHMVTFGSLRAGAEAAYPPGAPAFSLLSVYARSTSRSCATSAPR